MKSLDLFCAFSPQLFSLAVSLDSIRIDCALNEAMIKVHPIAEWWVSQLSISQSIKIGLSFVHPRSLCLYLTWQLSAKSSYGIPPFIVYTSFECVQLWYLLLPPPNHYLTMHPCHRFFFILRLHRPRLLNAFICKEFSQAGPRWRQENLNPDFPHMLHPLTSSLMKSRSLYWRHQVAQACV